MSDIRVTYSGLISFSTVIFSIITGLIFMIIVTRMLSPQEYGEWGLIGGILVYAMLTDTIIGYWAKREIARGINSGKTAIASTGIFSSIGIGIYLFSAYFIGLQPHIDQGILFFAVMLVPLRAFDKILTSINSGWKPEAVSYSALMMEIVKIPTALILLFYFDMKVDGVIITFAIALIIGNIIQLKYARRQIKNRFKKKYLKKWIKFFWIPIVPKIVDLLRSSDVIIFSIITGSVIGIAYFSASLIIASILVGAGAISSSIQAKLLGGGKQNYIGENFRLMFYFMIPIASFSIVFAKAGLFVLNPIYENASIIVIILTIKTFFFVLSQTFSSLLLGIEKVDINSTSTKDYFNSRLFTVPALRLIQFGIYLVTLSIMLIIMQEKISEIDLVVNWAIISLILQIPITLFFFYKMKQNFVIKIDITTIIKYFSVSGFVFSLMFFIINEFLVFNEAVIEFLPNLILFAIMGFGLYYLITFTIDKNTKEITKLVLKTIRK